MLQTWNQNRSKNFGQIEIVDIKPKEEVRQNWDDFFVREHYSITNNIEHTYLLFHGRRSCEAFASATLYNNTWGDSDCPRNTNSLREYQEWAFKTIQSEIKHDKDRTTPISRW